MISAPKVTGSSPVGITKAL